MFLGRISVIAAVMCGLTTHVAYAEVTLEAVDACINSQIAAGADISSCVMDAHAECFSIDESTPLVAVVCFHDAGEVWNGGIRSLMETVITKAPEDISAIAGIETKYDILSGLMQCDRMQELSLAVSSQTGEEIQRQKAQCDATAVGIAYSRLFWRSRDLP